GRVSRTRARVLSSRPSRATFAPRADRSRAMASPSPRAAPVTTAVRPRSGRWCTGGMERLLGRGPPPPVGADRTVGTPEPPAPDAGPGPEWAAPSARRRAPPQRPARVRGGPPRRVAPRRARPPARTQPRGRRPASIMTEGTTEAPTRRNDG